jgi:hypothetical protein
MFILFFLPVSSPAERAMIDFAEKALRLLVSGLVDLNDQFSVIEADRRTALRVYRVLEGEHIVFAIFVGVAESAELLVIHSLAPPTEIPA